MGTCCSAHLTAKVRDYAPNAQNRAVTVTVIEDPRIKIIGVTVPQGAETSINIPRLKCDYCDAFAEFAVSYFPKRES